MDMYPVQCPSCKWTGYADDDDLATVARHDAAALADGRDPEDCGPLEWA